LLRQRFADRYTKNVTQMQFLPVYGLFDWGGRWFLGAGSAQQMPNSAERSNACNAAAQKRLAKCEKPLISGHFGGYW
jgi:hypothetical protein